jgi:DNA-binding CsgD family transcriptional regulator
MAAGSIGLSALPAMTQGGSGGIVVRMIGYEEHLLSNRSSAAPAEDGHGDDVLAALEARCALLRGAAAALATPDADLAAELFEAALAVHGAGQWPFDVARVHLWYGERLRRARAITRSRVHLGAALDTFRGLGAAIWAERAAAELRAACPSRGRDDVTAGPGGAAAWRGLPPFEALTSQEHEIARLAATGLTNKEIGRRLYMSHRTVGAHLYRLFPKLGIRSRAALRDALAARDALTAP